MLNFSENEIISKRDGYVPEMLSVGQRAKHGWPLGPRPKVMIKRTGNFEMRQRSQSLNQLTTDSSGQ